MYGCIKLDVYIYEQEVTIKMQAKIKQTKTNNKQSNKQSLVQPDKVVPNGVAILSRGRRRMATTEATFRDSCVRWCVLERVLDLIIKLWLMF